MLLAASDALVVDTKEALIDGRGTQLISKRWENDPGFGEVFSEKGTLKTGQNALALHFRLKR
jgi:hypothetical protein